MIAWGRQAAVVTLSVVLAAGLITSFLIGPADIAPGRLLAGLFGAADPTANIIAQEIRLPRTILAAAIGAALGLSGAVLQGFLRNPLAEPAILGVSASAALGAVIALYYGLMAVFPLALPVFAVTGAFIAAFAVHALAGREASMLTLILAGVAINSLAGSLVALALNLAPNPHAALEIAFWLLGSLTDRSMVHLWLSLPFIVVGIGVLLMTGRGLDALSLGERSARSMGINLGRLQGLVIIGTAAAVGASVAVAGVIGFVGLVVPHLLRPFTGHEPSRLLPVSALGGAVALTVADICVRLVPTPGELKLGVLTGIVGAPFFLALLMKTRTELR
mgnify:CR=1 FL=1